MLTAFMNKIIKEKKNGYLFLKFKEKIFSLNFIEQ